MINPSSIFQLNFHSKSKIGILESELEEILQSAATYNKVENITGCLIFHKNQFVQILEGNKESVVAIYNKIKTDTRHFDITLLWECEVEKRYFQDWNMAYYHPEEGDIKQFEDNLLLLSDLAEKETSTLLSFWATIAKVLQGTKVI